MGKLLRFEFRKLFRAKSFYILGGILLAWFITDCLISGLPGHFKDPVEIVPAYPFYKGLINSFCMLFVGVFVAIYCSQDMTLGTIKNIYGKGYSRTKVYFSKYIVTLVGTLSMFLVGLLVALAFLPLFDLSQPIQDNVFAIIVGQLLGIIAYHGLFFGISTGFRHLAASLSINLMVPIVMSPVVTLIDVSALKDASFKISPYWIDGLIGTFNAGAVADPSRFALGYILLTAYALAGILIGFVAARKKQV